MTNDTKSITPATAQVQSVQKYGDNRAIAMEIKALRHSLPNLSDATDADVAALLIASKYSNLNPYAGEIYLIPQKGVMTASKIKAADAVSAAAKRGDTLSISFDGVNPGTDLYAELGLAEGDVAYRCRIISSKSRQSWYNHRLAAVTEMKSLGYSRPEMETKLAEMFPGAPEYTAVGIVKGAEDFGDSRKKAQVFSRQDRAKKRALIKCLNVNGLAAPDQRTYGDVPLASDESIDGQYTVSPSTSKTPEQIQGEIDPAFAAEIAESSHDAAQALGWLESESLVEDANAPPTTEVPDVDALSATDARARITRWANAAGTRMATAPIDQASAISAAISAARSVYANKQATIGDLNRSANVLRDLAVRTEAQTMPF